MESMASMPEFALEIQVHSGELRLCTQVRTCKLCAANVTSDVQICNVNSQAPAVSRAGKAARPHDVGSEFLEAPREPSAQGLCYGWRHLFGNSCCYSCHGRKKTAILPEPHEPILSFLSWLDGLGPASSSPTRLSEDFVCLKGRD